MPEAPGSAYDLTLLIPLYRAKPQLPALLQGLREHQAQTRYRTEYVLVCDGSDDGTAEDLAARLPRDDAFRLVAYPVNRGKGWALRTGAAGARGRAVGFTDADLAYPLAQLDGFVEAVLVRGVDLAIANRVDPRSRFELSALMFGYVLRRHLASRLYNFLARLILGVPYRDLQAGFKVFGRRVVDELLPRVESERFGFDLELLALAHREGLTVEERPVTVRWENAPSTVGFVKTGLDLFRTLGRIFVGPA